MKVRFHADANFNQKMVSVLLLREPSIDFALPQEMIPEGMKDPDVLDLHIRPAVSWPRTM